MNFISVKSNFEEEEYNALLNHEKKAIDGIIKNGLYYCCFKDTKRIFKLFN